jgi:hypothetical protein
LDGFLTVDPPQLTATKGAEMPPMLVLERFPGAALS